MSLIQWLESFGARRVRRRVAYGLLGFVCVGVAGCQGDALEPEPEVVGPAAVAVTLDAGVPARAEANDTLSFAVTAVSTSGTLREIGAAARVHTPTGTSTPVLIGSEAAFGSQASRTFRVTVQELIDLLPASSVPAEGTLLVEASAYAVHSNGACVAAFAGDTALKSCTSLSPTGRIAAGSTTPMSVQLVRGQTIALRAGMTSVGDLLVHPGSGRLFASNTAANALDLIDLNNFGAGFTTRIPVGSRPLGLDLDRTGQNVIVANSGGTNISFVPVTSAAEDRSRRFEVPRATLYDYLGSDSMDVNGVPIVTGTGANEVKLDFHNFADRPQYVVQDVNGRLLYSAVSTGAAPIGTIRLAEWRTGWSGWDARFLFPCCVASTNQQAGNRAIEAADGFVAIANADSMSIVMAHNGPYAYPTNNVVIWDHVPGTLPGDPGRLIRTDTLPILHAIQQAYASGSDVLAYPRHTWAIPDAPSTAAHTTVAASGDRRWVLFGEWPTTSYGRLMMWSATDTALNRVEDIADVLNNSSDRINAVALNHAGTIGVGRGEAGVYFFDRMLRLQGTGGDGLAGGNGITFMPGARAFDDDYVFAGTGRASIQILEPAHFRVLGEVRIRENVTGALRAAPCASGAPADCIATLYAVTARGITAVHVGQSDLVPAFAAALKR